MNSRTPKVLAVAAVVLALAVVLGWNQNSAAQNLLKPAGGGQKGWYGEFQSLLAAHGNANMKLEAHVVTANEGDLIGTLSGATDAFLIMKGQGEGRVYFITWDDVIWITARPN